MAFFGRKSLEQIKTCHPELQKVAFSAIRWFGFAVTEGQRGEAKQHEYFTKGRSRVDWPFGEHNGEPANAFDFLPDSVSWDDLNGVNGEAMRQKGVNACYFLAGVLVATGEAMGIPLRSGADWDGDGNLKDQNFNDIVHIERRKEN